MLNKYNESLCHMKHVKKNNLYISAIFNNEDKMKLNIYVTFSAVLVHTLSIQY